MTPNVNSTSSGHFNFSSKLIPIFNLPSRFLARIRLFDELFSQDLVQNHAISVTHEWGAATILAQTSAPPPSGLTSFPGPWGFLTSGYALVLFTMVSLYSKGTTRSLSLPRSHQGHHSSSNTKYSCSSATPLCIPPVPEYQRPIFIFSLDIPYRLTIRFLVDTLASDILPPISLPSQQSASSMDGHSLANIRFVPFRKLELGV
jgi:hypothetical protein